MANIIVEDTSIAHRPLRALPEHLATGDWVWIPKTTTSGPMLFYVENYTKTTMCVRYLDGTRFLPYRFSRGYEFPANARIVSELKISIT